MSAPQPAGGLSERAAAVREARDLLTYLDHGPEDLLIVADWLITGRCETALKFAEQRGRLYTEHQGERPSLDAATWSPPPGDDTRPGSES